MSLGGSSTTTVEQQIPKYIEDASKQAIKASSAGGGDRLCAVHGAGCGCHDPDADGGI